MIDTDDFETSIRAALNADVDAQLGPRRAAPPFDPTHVPTPERDSRHGWLIPLLAAACVVAVVGAVIAAAAVLGGGSHRPTPPATQSPAPTPTHTPTPPGRLVDGARLVLPRGWTVRPMARWVQRGYGSAFDFCLSPTSAPVVRGNDTCPLAFSRARADLVLDPDIEGGYQADPHPCGQAPSTTSAITRPGTLGGRPADFRAWSIVCTRTHQAHKIMQFVAVGSPAYVLFTDHGGRDVGQAMDLVAARSTLPAQDAPLPLFDRGVVTAATSTKQGVRIELQRDSTPYGTTQVIKDRSGHRDAYVVPTAMWQAGRAKVGSQVTLYTDGHRVSSVQVAP